MGHPNASSAFDGQDWRHHVAKKGRESNCPKLAQATMNHAAKEPMGHLYYDLRRIFQPLTNVTKRPLLVIRTENLWDDFHSTLNWLGDEEKLTSTPSLRNSTLIDYPVNKTISPEGKHNLCVALQDEYRIYLRLIVLAQNLSQEQQEVSWKIATQNCPGLNLTLPDRNMTETLVSSSDGSTWEF
jgi:hypothetical protein